MFTRKTILFFLFLLLLTVQSQPIFAKEDPTPQPNHPNVYLVKQDDFGATLFMDKDILKKGDNVQICYEFYTVEATDGANVELTTVQHPENDVWMIGNCFPPSPDDPVPPVLCHPPLCVNLIDVVNMDDWLLFQ